MGFGVYTVKYIGQVVVIRQVERLVLGIAVEAEVEEKVVIRRDTFDRLSVGLSFEGSEGFEGEEERVERTMLDDKRLYRMSKKYDKYNLSIV